LIGARHGRFPHQGELAISYCTRPTARESSGSGDCTEAELRAYELDDVRLLSSQSTRRAGSGAPLAM
jgi:hypothetical protein